MNKFLKFKVGDIIIYPVGFANKSEQYIGKIIKITYEKKLDMKWRYHIDWFNNDFGVCSDSIQLHHRYSRLATKKDINELMVEWI